MKKTLLTLAVFASFVAAPAIASDASQAWRQQPTVPAGLTVQAGSAPIEQALSTIIPAPYHIELDRSVPASAVIVWPAGNDWMKVLRAAVAPLELYVEPDWQSNTIRVVHLSSSSNYEDSAQRMPAPATGADRTVLSEGRLAAKDHAPVFQPLPTLRPGAIPTIETLPPQGWRAPAVTHGMVTSVDVSPSNLPGRGYVIPAGTMLSQGLANYAKTFGWTMRWNITEDYLLDAPLPIPAGSVFDGVSFVVRTYQSQGGLLGDTPLFAKPNHVVVIQPASIREN